MTSLEFTPERYWRWVADNQELAERLISEAVRAHVDDIHDHCAEELDE